MQIAGLQKLTLLDYPGAVACIVFTAGCNFRCPYCHNGGIVKDVTEIELLGEEEVFAYLRKRAGILDGVVISGGEPLLQPDVELFMEKVRALGYQIKLDTNGSFPDKLERLLARGLVDYVAMDLKDSPACYGRAIGREIQEWPPGIRQSIELLRGSGVPYEFRTTLVKGIHSPGNLEDLAGLLRQDETWFLQSYEDSGGILNPEGLSSFSKDEMNQMLQIAKKFCGNAQLRDD